MSDKSFGREFAEELYLKAIHTAVPIAAGIIWSNPLGAAVGIATVVAIGSLVKGGGGSTTNTSGSKGTGSST